MQFGLSGRFLVSGTCQYDLLLWSLKDGKLNTTFDGHTSFVWGLDISSDDEFLASGGQDKTLRFWNLNQMDREPTIVSVPDVVYTAAFAVDTPALAAGIGSYGVWLFEVPSGSIIIKMDLTATSVLRFSTRGNWLVHGDRGDGLSCWSTEDLLSDKVRTGQGLSVKRQTTRAPGSSSNVYSVAKTSNGVWTFCMCSSGEVYALNGEGTPGILVGTVASTGPWPYMDLGPVSDDGMGILACCGQSRNLAVYKFASWDAEGASRF
ncbi:Jouberin [Tulasnella sp. 403]|nr:Jouberin [Tulasnella sp. 403]